MNNFALHLKFNTAADLTEALDGHSVMLLHSITLADGSSRAKVFLTVKGMKFAICSLNSARSSTAKVALRITKDDGEVIISCSQGGNVVVSGLIESDSCCDHDHGEHEHTDELTNGMELDSELEEDDDVAEEDEEEEEEEEDEEDEEEEDEEEEDDEEDEEDEEEDEEEVPVSSKATPTKDSKKVTFNQKEQGPHTPVGAVAPVKPVLKQTSTVGTTLSLPGGLKYTILREGRGPVAAYGKRVNVRYVGCLASNGKQFDKGTIKFRLGAGEVIEGWDKGVKDMRVGESRRLLIPAHLGYGQRGAPPAIPKNAALAFEVELLDLQ